MSMATGVRKRKPDNLIEASGDADAKSPRTPSSLKRRRVATAEFVATEHEGDSTAPKTSDVPSTGLGPLTRQWQKSEAQKEKYAGATVAAGANGSLKPIEISGANQQPSHLRFGSEEPAAVLPTIVAADRAKIPDSGADDDEDDSEDDAPEAVSASTAREVAQGTAKDARKAAAAYVELPESRNAKVYSH